MLAGKFALYDCDDVEALAERVVALSGLTLSWHEREDLTTYLIETAWQLSLRFDADRLDSFGAFAWNVLRLRTTDWLRQRRGRTRWQFADSTYERERPTLVSFDARLVELVAEGAGDFADGGDLSLAGVLDAGDRQRAWDLELLGLEPPQ